MTSHNEHVAVSEVAVRLSMGQQDDRLWVDYQLGKDWMVRIEGETSAEADGPTAVVLRRAEGSSRPAAVTAEVLRTVPLNDARKVLRRLRADALATQDSQEEGVYQLPGRMVTEADWIKFARAYARAATQNPHQPIVQLARATGLSPNTISARMRRAQELGLLESAGAETQARTPWLVLAGKAKYNVLRKV